jgi:hypothetical protein
MWKANESVRWHYAGGRWVAPSEIINPRIDALCAEYDLRLGEWHYWAKIASQK